MPWLLIVLSIIALDQIIKQLVVKHIAYGSILIIIKKFFYLTYLENRGAAWSMFENGRYFFIALTIIVSGVIIYYLFKEKNMLLRLSLSFILGGAIGNLIDRVIKGSVTDFLGVWLGPYQYPVFNVADSFIVIGAIIIIYHLLFIQKGAKEQN